MAGLTAAAAGGAWTYGGSILTFVFPMLLFLIVGAVLWVLFTKPQVVPGQPDRANERSVGSTRVANAASGGGPAAGGHTAEGGPTATAEGGPTATAVGGPTATAEGGPTATAEGEGR